VENRWPELGSFMPGAIEAANTLHAAGLSLVLQSCRLSPVNPFTGELNDQSITDREIEKVRNLLNRAGLDFINVWTGPGKAGGWRYVDDRGIWYPGTTRGWQKVTQKLLLAAGKDVDLSEGD
jgi:hypothetical protein